MKLGTDAEGRLRFTVTDTVEEAREAARALQVWIALHYFVQGNDVWGDQVEMCLMDAADTLIQMHWTKLIMPLLPLDHPERHHFSSGRVESLGSGKDVMASRIRHCCAALVPIPVNTPPNCTINPIALKTHHSLEAEPSHSTLEVTSGREIPQEAQSFDTLHEPPGRFAKPST